MPDQSLPAAEETTRILELLGALTRAAPHSQRECCRRAGLHLGYLSEVVRGRTDLKLPHLLRLLHALGVDPKGFFECALSPRGEGPVEDLRVRRLLVGLDPDPPAVADLERLLAGALAREMGLEPARALDDPRSPLPGDSSTAH